MQDRREFLKLFGVGAAIVPIIGGVPVAAAESKLIEVPKVTLAEKSSMPAGEFIGNQLSLADGEYEMTVMLKKPDRQLALLARTFVISVDQEVIPLRSWKSRYPTDVAAKLRTARWTMRGEFITQLTGEVLSIIES